MTQITLTFYERVVLWNMIGAATAPSLKETAVYLRLIEKIRLTDQESLESQFFSEGGQVSWKLPRENYGSLPISLEDEEARTLAKVIESTPNIRVVDASWLNRVVAATQPAQSSANSINPDGAKANPSLK